jgi:hypothetical protein
MVGRPLLVIVMLAGLAAPAWPCSVMGPLPSAEALVRDADVIVRARAEGLSSTSGDVTFAILDVLKGSLPAATIAINGSLLDRDDRNDQPVPYDFVRPGGRSGNCYALEYRAGAEYLLLLRGGKHPSKVQRNGLTPYWAPLSPTNEQLFGGARDAWFVWVSRTLRKGQVQPDARIEF